MSRVVYSAVFLLLSLSSCQNGVRFTDYELPDSRSCFLERSKDTTQGDVLYSGIPFDRICTGDRGVYGSIDKNNFNTRAEDQQRLAATLPCIDSSEIGFRLHIIKYDAVQSTVYALVAIKNKSQSVLIIPHPIANDVKSNLFYFSIEGGSEEILYSKPIDFQDPSFFRGNPVTRLFPGEFAVQEIAVRRAPYSSEEGWVGYLPGYIYSFDEVGVVGIDWRKFDFDCVEFDGSFGSNFANFPFYSEVLR